MPKQLYTCAQHFLWKKVSFLSFFPPKVFSAILSPHIPDICKRAFLYYLHVHEVRPSLPSTSTSVKQPALLLSSGRPLVNYPDLIKTLCRRYNLSRLPTLTSTRKAGATKFLKTARSPEEMEGLSRHMSHRTTTSQKYYRLANRKEEAVAMQPPPSCSLDAVQDSIKPVKIQYNA